MKSDTQLLYGMTGCKHHLMFRHPSGEWIQFTREKMVVARAVYAYCNVAFVINDKPCPQCQEDLCSAETASATMPARGA